MHSPRLLHYPISSTVDLSGVSETQVSLPTAVFSAFSCGLVIARGKSLRIYRTLQDHSKKEDGMNSNGKLGVKAVICAIIVGLSMPALALADWPGQRWQRNWYDRYYDRNDRRDDRWERRRFRQRQRERERLLRYYQYNQDNRWNNNYQSQLNPWSSRNWWSRPFRY